MTRCRDCALWSPEGAFSPPREQCEPDDLGECLWQPAGGLPYSWRYCRRERTLTEAQDGANCPQHTPEPTP